MLAAVILLIATNAGLIGVSRLTYSMGQHRQLPEGLRQVHPKYRTPYIAILIFAAVAILTLLPGQTDFLATIYSFGAMLSFTIAHVAVIQLRRNQRDAERPWKPPLNLHAFGFELPLTAVLGGLGTFAAWIVVMALNPRTLIVGIGWMLLGIAVYVLYRRNQRLPLTETVKVVLPEPLGVEEVEYRSVLVGFEDDEDFSAEMVATAVKLASKRRRGIHVHSMLTVPTNLPLNADMPEQEGRRPAQDRAGEADRRPARHRPRRPRPPRPGRVLGRRGGEADQGGGDRRRPAPPRRRAALRQDPADRPRRAPLPGDRRLRPRRRPPRSRPRPCSRWRDEGAGRGRAPYRGAVTGFSLVFVAIGAALLVATLATGGGPASVGFLMGIAFLAIGAGRLWINSRARR